MMTLYKWLRGRNGTHATGFRYRLRRWTPAVEGDLVPCVNGYHLMRAEHLSGWIARDLYVAEMDETLDWIETSDKIVCRRARIVEHLTGWNERTARLAAADFAEMALPFYERVRSDDDRPRRTIQAARDYANGLIDDAALHAAWVDVAAVTAVTAAAWHAAAAAARAASASAAADAAGAAATQAARAASASAAAKAGIARVTSAVDETFAAQGEIILDYAYGRRGQ